MPWDALHSPGLLCFAIALGFLGLGALHMHDWRADEVSFSLQTPFLALEGTLRDIEPKELAAGNIVAAQWVVPAAFSAMALVMGMWCARNMALR